MIGNGDSTVVGDSLRDQLCLASTRPLLLGALIH